MAGSLPGGALNAIGTALIPETMARLQMPALIDQAKREQQVGNIQAGRLLGAADAQIGTPQTKAFKYTDSAGNERVLGQNNPSTIQPLFSPAKKMALFSQAFPEQARAVQAQQLTQQLFPQGFTGTLGQDQVAYQNNKIVAEGPKSAPKVDKLPAEAELAKWLFGGNEAAAREYIKRRQDATQADTGLNPIYGRDVQGNVVVMQPTKTGQLIQSAVPEGITPMAPRDVAFERAAGAASGTVEGQRSANAPALIQTAQIALQNIRDLKNHQALPSALGAIEGRLAAIAGEQADVVSRIDQIKGRAFLQAFDTLKGGGAISEQEGAAATAAIARLNRVQSPKEFKAALTELENVVQSAMNRAQNGSLVGNPTASIQDLEGQIPAPPASQALEDPLGIRKR